MLGFGIGVLGTSAAVWISWKSYNRLADPRECRTLQDLLKSGVVGSARRFRSRPHELLEELSMATQAADDKVAIFNDVLADVDANSKIPGRENSVHARVAFLSGMAGAVGELAANVGSAKRIAIWAGSALILGVLGAAICTAIGQAAIAGLRRRRQLWDEFIRWILNSHFPRTELNVPAIHSDPAGEGRQPERQRS